MSDRWPPVRTKQDFVRRYEQGEFGNHAPTWSTIGEYMQSGYSGLVHIRNRVAGGPTWYNVSAERVVELWGLATRKSSPHLLYISAMAPTERTLFQGEIFLGPGGYWLTYSRVAKPMREALREQATEARGVSATVLLDYYLDSHSRQWLDVLLDRYENHVVEFSTYSVKWGTLLGYNTVFWEVRLY